MAQLTQATNAASGILEAADIAPVPLDPDTRAMVDHAFSYHKPEGDQSNRYVAIREAGKAFAEVLLSVCPSSADRTAALRQIQDAVMTANRSIALGGKGMR